MATGAAGWWICHLRVPTSIGVGAVINVCAGGADFLQVGKVDAAMVQFFQSAKGMDPSLAADIHIVHVRKPLSE